VGLGVCVCVCVCGWVGVVYVRACVVCVCGRVLWVCAGVCYGCVWTCVVWGACIRWGEAGCNITGTAELAGRVALHDVTPLSPTDDRLAGAGAVGGGTGGNGQESNERNASKRHNAVCGWAAAEGNVTHLSLTRPTHTHTHHQMQDAADCLRNSELPSATPATIALVCCEYCADNRGRNEIKTSAGQH